jgi:hypothetical protein
VPSIIGAPGHRVLTTRQRRALPAWLPILTDVSRALRADCAVRDDAPLGPSLQRPSSAISVSHLRSTFATLRSTGLICEVNSPDPHLLNDFWFNSRLRQPQASPRQFA